MASPLRGHAGLSERHDPTTGIVKTPVLSAHAVTLLVIVVVILGAIWILLHTRLSPFSEASVSQDLSEASDSQLSIGGYRQTYFPAPGCILSNLEFRHGPDHAKFITIEALTIQGSYSGFLTHHVPRVTATGVRVFIPRFGTGASYNSTATNTIIDELLASDAVVEFAPEKPGTEPLRFVIHDAALKNVRSAGAIGYELRFRNPNPPGEILVKGNFGPWPSGNPAQTPFSGAYTFDHADLSVYDGIGGTLASLGKFDGVLQHVNVSGNTEVPDFYVKSGGHKVRLATQFDAYVNAMNGDTFLNRVAAQLGKTNVTAEGSIARVPGHSGKYARLNLTAPKGRIEDLLGLFVSAPRSPMSGPVAIRTRVEIPPDGDSFLQKVRLDGKFGIDEGRFTKPDTQHDVDALSAGARGESNTNKEDPETVMTDLSGTVAVTGGRAAFSDLSFFIPGAHARMHGSYDLISHRIDLHGRMRVDTRISKTTSGMKSFLLKVMDPLFKKKKTGEVVPVHILGTYEKPQFGLDIASQKDQKQAGR